MEDSTTVNVRQNVVDDYYEGQVLVKESVTARHGKIKTVMCERQSENKKYMIKVIDISKSQNRPQAYQHAMNEIFILDVLRNSCGEYITCYIRTIIQSPMVYIISDYLEKYKPLQTIFFEARRTYKTSKPTFLKYKQMAKLFHNMLLGLEQLHSLNIYHRNISPVSIMCNIETFEIKYINFDNAVMSIGGILSPRTTHNGTMDYIYPKLLEDVPPPYTVDLLRTADRYSVGVTIIVTLLRGWNMRQYFHRNGKFDAYPSKPEQIAFYSNIQSMLQDPEYSKYSGNLYTYQESVMAIAREDNLKYEKVETLIGIEPLQPPPPEDEEVTPAEPALTPAIPPNPDVSSSVTMEDKKGGKRRSVSKTSKIRKGKWRNCDKSRRCRFHATAFKT